MLLLLLVALTSPLVVQTKDTHFDIFILTQHWPYTTCLDWKERSPANGCRKIGEPTWSVHGLWPTQFGKVAPGFCDNHRKFNYSSVEPIRAQLDQYWPDYEIRNEPNSLWSHEWEKHGTCAAQLPSMDTELKYFQAGVDLAKLMPIYSWLENASITPGDRYTKKEMHDAVMDQTKFRPHIDCEHIDGDDFIKEIKICFTKNLSLTHCDNIVYDVNLGKRRVGGSCKDNIQFIYPNAASPPKGGNHLMWGLFFGLTGAAGVMISMIVLYVKSSRGAHRGYESI